MATEKNHALYLVSPDDDRIELVHADDVEARKSEGWKEPDGLKANGQEWNAERDLPGQDIAADIAKQTAEADAKEEAKKAKEETASEAKSESKAPAKK